MKRELNLGFFPNLKTVMFQYTTFTGNSDTKCKLYTKVCM